MTEPCAVHLADFDVKGFQRSLLRWWKKHKRHYPWRSTRSLYRVLVAEVLLHRTRADQVVPVYHALIARFPSIRSLADSDYPEVERLLTPAGLRWRTRLLHEMAKEVVRRHNGRIPVNREELEALPGVSHYIASAVRCFALGADDVLLDTNTVRIVGRLMGVPVTDGSRRSRTFRELLEFLIDRHHPRAFNFALIDLGAQICRARQPRCAECPVSGYCNYARKIGGNNP